MELWVHNTYIIFSFKICFVLFNIAMDFDILQWSYEAKQLVCARNWTSSPVIQRHETHVLCFRPEKKKLGRSWWDPQRPDGGPCGWSRSVDGGSQASHRWSSEPEPRTKQLHWSSLMRTGRCPFLGEHMLHYRSCQSDLTYVKFCIIHL